MERKGMSEKEKRAEFAEIMAAMQLTDPELAANRIGTFTVANAKHLEWHLEDNGSLFGCLVFALLFIGCVAIAMLVMSGRGQAWGLVLLVMVGLMALFLTHVARRDRNLNRDLDEHGVAAATGELQTSFIYGR